MAATELARVLFAVNTILEKASSKVGLSKRAALALAVIAIDPEYPKDLKGKPAMTNKGLQDRLVKYKISTDASIKKDASSAKSELLAAGYIAIQGRVSVVIITPEGAQKVDEMYGAMADAMLEAGLNNDERGLLRSLLRMPPPPDQQTPKMPPGGKNPTRPPASSQPALPNRPRRTSG